MKYPRVANWLVWKKNKDGSYSVEDALTGYTYTIGATIGDFARRLDGTRDPYFVMSKLRHSEVDDLLNTLSEHDLVRTSNILYKEFLDIAVSVWIPRRIYRKNTFLIILNAIRRFFWLPIFVFGLLLFERSLVDISNGPLWLGSILGLVLGSVFHEVSHIISGICYGARFFEMGIAWKYGLPSAYVLLDDERIKNRLHRVQVIGAGIQCNFFLSGIFFALIVWCNSLSQTFFMAAFMNLMLGLINLLFVDGLDGMRMIGLLLGECNIVEKSKKVLHDKDLRNKLWNEYRYEELIVCYTMAILQVLSPVLIILNVSEVLLWLFS